MTASEKEIFELEVERDTIEYYLQHQAGGNQVKIKQKEKRLRTIKKELNALTLSQTL